MSNSTPPEVHFLVFLVHAKALVEVEGLESSAVVADVVEAPLDDDEVLINLRVRASIPMVLVA